MAKIRYWKYHNKGLFFSCNKSRGPLLLLLARAIDAKSNATQTWECNKRYYFGAYILSYCQSTYISRIQFNPNFFNMGSNWLQLLKCRIKLTLTPKDRNQNVIYIYIYIYYILVYCQFGVYIWVKVNSMFLMWDQMDWYYQNVKLTLTPKI